MIVKVYPFALLLIAVLLNVFVFGLRPLVISVPSHDSIVAIVVSAILLVINHSWLMTATELVRVRFGMYTTPEEWAASGRSPSDVTDEGLAELERRHNAHRNTTENTVYYVLLALIFIIVTPAPSAVLAWVLAFPIARLGYTYSYLSKNTGARGFFMSVGLLAVYGMATYLALGLAV